MSLGKWLLTFRRTVEALSSVKQSMGTTGTVTQCHVPEGLSLEIIIHFKNVLASLCYWMFVKGNLMLEMFVKGNFMLLDVGESELDVGDVGERELDVGDVGERELDVTGCW